MLNWPEGVQYRVFQTLDSTMAEAARQAPDIAGPIWIHAHHQSNARGRRGRAWAHPTGNFSATLIYKPMGTVETRALRSFVAALALRDAVIAATGRESGVSLKWPNDVLLNGGKLAGILLESVGDHLAIGIGVNLVATPTIETLEVSAVAPVSLWQETGVKVSVEEFLPLIASAFAKWEAQLTEFGFAPIRTAWLNNAARLGEVITARLPNSEVTGTFQTIDEYGMLVLKAADGPHSIAAADVFF